MPRKRQPLSFPELEPKGRGAILRSAEEVAAEEQALADQELPLPPPRPARAVAESEAKLRATYEKVSYRLSPEAIQAIGDMKLRLRHTYGLKASLEMIAEEAILAAYRDLLENQAASGLVLALKPGGPHEV